MLHFLFEIVKKIVDKSQKMCYAKNREPIVGYFGHNLMPECTYAFSKTPAVKTKIVIFGGKIMKKTIKVILSCILVATTVMLSTVAIFAEFYAVYSLDEYKGFEFAFRANNKATGADFGIPKGNTVELEGNVWFDIDPQTPPHYITSVVKLCYKQLFSDKEVIEINLYPGSLGNDTNYKQTSLVYSNSASADIDVTRDYYVTVETSGTDDAYYSTYIVNVNFEEKY